MRKGLVQIAMDKGDIVLRGGSGVNSVHNIPYREIKREGVFILGNIGMDVLGKSVSVFIRDDISKEHKVIMVYGEDEGILARVYKRNLSAVQVLREIYQKIRGY